jgi:hypothetical protein
LYTQVDAVAVLFGPYPTCLLLGDASNFRYRIPPEFQTYEWPWRELIEANPDLHFAWHSDAYVFELNPMLHLHGFVTRAQRRDDGSFCDPPDWFAADALSVDQALHMMTIGSAYALFLEDQVGSLQAGKQADMIILSDNPYTIDPNAILDLNVLMTMIGGEMIWCAPGSESLCP